MVGYEAQHLAQLGRFHQITVDAYAAQHPTTGGSGIGVALALIGLHLALDERWRGDQVRDVHQVLAANATKWPGFDPPLSRGSMTIFDVAMAGSPEAHARLVQGWAADVWAAWSGQRPAVGRLLDERLTRADRARIRRA